jgi:hypothetical protein
MGLSVRVAGNTVCPDAWARRICSALHGSALGNVLITITVRYLVCCNLQNICVYSCFKGPIEGVWQHDLFQQSAGSQQRPTAGGDASARLGKLLISNLDFGVNDADIQVTTLNTVLMKVIKFLDVLSYLWGCLLPH